MFPTTRRSLLQTALATGVAVSVPRLFTAQSRGALAQPEKERREQNVEKLRITMWDVSAALTQRAGGPYADVDKRLDEALERGYNTIRIEAFPLLKYPPTGEPWSVITLPPPAPLQLSIPWSAYGGFSVKPHENTVRLLKHIRRRGLRAILTTWVFQFFTLFGESRDLQERIKRLTLEERIRALASAWKKLLAEYADMDLLDTIAYVELHNEANVALLRFGGRFAKEDETRHVFNLMGEAVQGIKDAFPDLLAGCSFTGDWNRVRDFVPDAFDVLAFHPWILSVPEVQRQFARRKMADYRLPDYEPPDMPAREARRYPPFLREFYGIDKTKLNRWYNEMAERCREPIRRYLRDTLMSVKGRADEIGALAALSEGYSVPWIYEGIEWKWIKEICAYAIEQAAKLDFFAVTTCNFSSPMFSLWDDIAWQQKMNSLLGGTIPSEQSESA